jgi:DNA-binding transcriptional LysR family regulator
MNITLKQLAAFLAVTDTLSFSKAAELVHLSQPALSANIRRLEETIGARLFDRDTRTVVLSSVGSEFVEVARHILDNIDHGLAHIHRFVSGRRGSLALAVAPSLAARFLPDVIREFSAAYPGIALRLHDVLSAPAIDLVRSRAVDIALTAERSDATDLVQRHVMWDDLVVLCASTHPLARRRSVGWKDLRAHPHIAKKDGSDVRRIIDEEYLRCGEVFRPAFEVDNISTMIGLILAGLGCGVFPRSTLGAFNMKGLACLPFAGRNRPRRRICAVTLKGRSPGAGVDHFADLCRKKAGERTEAGRRAA